MEFSEQEKEMIVASIDVSIATLSRSVGQMAPEQRQGARLNIARYLNLQQKVQAMEVESPQLKPEE